MRAKYTAIVAVANDDVIGYDNGIPWPRLKADMKHFKQTTMNGVVVMGRKTFDSIGRPLPDRLNYVLTRNEDMEEIEDSVYVFNTLDDCTSFVDYCEFREVFVIGGKEIFSLFSGLIDKVILTRVDFSLPVDRDEEKVVRWQWPEGSWMSPEVYRPLDEGEIKSWLEIYYRR